jgi:hypothetical protein
MPARTPIDGDKDQNSGFIIVIVPRIRVASIYDDIVVEDGSMTRFNRASVLIFHPLTLLVTYKGHFYINIVKLAMLKINKAPLSQSNKINIQIKTAKLYKLYDD